jgi:hypothetical protein
MISNLRMQTRERNIETDVLSIIVINGPSVYSSIHASQWDFSP